jgi:hypothetical protein
MRLARFFKFLKWGAISTAVAALLWFALGLAMYRIPSGPERQVEGEVHFKFLELSLSNRAIFEEVLENRRVRLARPENEKDVDAFYIPDAQIKRLWEVSPHELRDRKQTLRIKLKSRPLLFGGNGPAEIVGIKLVDNEPSISK